MWLAVCFNWLGLFQRGVQGVEQESRLVRSLERTAECRDRVADRYTAEWLSYCNLTYRGTRLDHHRTAESTSFHRVGSRRPRGYYLYPFSIWNIPIQFTVIELEFDLHEYGYLFEFEFDIKFVFKWVQVWNWNLDKCRNLYQI